MREYIRRSHNVKVLLYQFVCPAKYRRVDFTDMVDTSLKEICIGISDRFEVIFIEIGNDKDQVHFLVQSVPMHSSTKIIQMVKSLTAKEIFRIHPEVKKKLWWGEIWTKGFYVNAVGMHEDKSTIKAFVKSQGRENEYKKIVTNCPCFNTSSALL